MDGGLASQEFFFFFTIQSRTEFLVSGYYITIKFVLIYHTIKAIIYSDSTDTTVQRYAFSLLFAF